ncbi:hypothetical protein [Streptomyces tanashiensis]|uniref:hypothetical protein n=1 Tax=Streptomyces tanashiensis TaxID=67367 RepID=UPI0034028109
MLMPFVVAVEPDALKRLNKVVARGLKAEVAWLEKARKREGVAVLRGKAGQAARARVRAEFAELRARGKLAGTRDLVLAREVRAELKRRGLDREFEPVPAGVAGSPGRPVGTSPRRAGRSWTDPTMLSARMAVRLPADLGEQLVRAAYWTSLPAVDALLEWQDRYGDGIEVAFLQAMRDSGPAGALGILCAVLKPRPSADDILERAQLQDRIVTTGDIIRSAAERAAP